MRTRKAIRNIAASVSSYFVFTVLKFITRNVLIQVVGKEVLGLNGLFTNIISIFALAELGFGTAIVYNLYKPLATGDKEKIKSYLQLYKRIYYSVGTLIVVLGIATLPFLPRLIKNGTLPISEVRLYFLLTVAASSITYFNSHRIALISADQKVYVEKTVSSVAAIVLSVLQCVGLLALRSYAVYLVLQFLVALIQNVVLSRIVEKDYPYVREKKIAPLAPFERKELFERIRGVIFHKVGGVITSSATSMLISMFIGITLVGEYSNYNLVLSVFSGVTGLIFTSFVAGLGNLIAVESAESAYKVFKRILFLNFWMNLLACVCLYCFLDPFIHTWLGTDYTMELPIVIAIVTQYAINSMLSAVRIFKDAAGLYYPDRLKPVIEVIINLGASILLVKRVGLIGVFLGSIIGTICTSVWTEPFMIYKYIFKRSPVRFYLLFWAMLAAIWLVSGITWKTLSFVSIVGFKNLIVVGIAVFAALNAIFVLIFRKRDEFSYFKSTIASLMGR